MRLLKGFFDNGNSILTKLGPNRTSYIQLEHEAFYFEAWVTSTVPIPSHVPLLFNLVKIRILFVQNQVLCYSHCLFFWNS